MQTIRLNGYTAAAPVPLLRLGTRDSFGIERLQVVPGAEWEGLALTATFVTPAGSTRMVVNEDGTVEVPAAATAAALTPETPGRIVFAGTGAGVQRITADLPTIISTNLTPEQLSASYADRIASRILCGSVIYGFLGKDIRLEKQFRARGE